MMGKLRNWAKKSFAPRGKRSFLFTLGGFLVSSIALTLLILWVGTLNFSFSRLLYYFNEPSMVLLNYLPVALLMLLLYLLCNRLWLSFLLSSAVGYVFAYVNYFKVRLRGEPFLAIDLTTLAEGVNAGGEFTLTFPVVFWLGLVCIAAGTLVLGFCCRWRIPKKRWWIRPVGILLSLGFVQFMWGNYYSDDNRYSLYNLNIFTHFNDWKAPEKFSHRGIIYSFCHSVTDLVVQAPANYDPDMVKEILSQYESEGIPEEKQINVQIHMLESFSDLSELGISFQKDPYESWHKLREESYYGTLITDTVGGGTVNAERSVMTGFTYIHPNYRDDSNSYIRIFRNSGYYTQATHPGDQWFYSRKNIDERLGFESTLFEENYFEDFPGVYHGKDADYFPLVRDLYEEKTAQGQPYFGFHVTYQNHTPYESTQLLGEEYISREGIDETSYYVLNNYLSGVQETVEQIAAYVDLYREDQEPVVLVFFGDHKATLGNDNSAYEALGINVSGETPDGCYNIYSTPYLIWVNEAARELLQKEVKGEGPVISPCYLMNEIFDICGWKGNTWMQYQSMVRQTIPVLHKLRTCLVDGVLTKELPEEVNTLRLQRNRVEFYWRYNLEES